MRVLDVCQAQMLFDETPGAPCQNGNGFQGYVVAKQRSAQLKQFLGFDRFCLQEVRINADVLLRLNDVLKRCGRGIQRSITGDENPIMVL